MIRGSKAVTAAMLLLAATGCRKPTAAAHADGGADASTARAAGSASMAAPKATAAASNKSPALSHDSREAWATPFPEDDGLLDEGSAGRISGTAPVALIEAGDAPMRVVTLAYRQGAQRKVTMRIASTTEVDGKTEANATLREWDESLLEAGDKDFRVRGIPRRTLHDARDGGAEVDTTPWVFTQSRSGAPTMTAEPRSVSVGVIFPEQPIGTGATWTVASRSTEGELSVVRKTRYRLLSISDTEAELSWESLGRGVVSNDGTRSETNARVVGASFRGRGHMRLPLTRLTGMRATFTEEGRLRTELPAKQERSTTATTLAISIDG